MAKDSMFIITIVYIAHIAYNFIKDKPAISTFLVLTVQSILLFLIRSFRINQSFSKSFLPFFDLFTIMVIATYLIYELSRRKEKGDN